MIFGVPIAPASPDVTPQATEVLDFDPDVIIYSAQGSDCWNLVDALGDFEDAIALACELGGGHDPVSIPIVEFPRPRTIFQQLEEMLETELMPQFGEYITSAAPRVIPAFHIARA